MNLTHEIMSENILIKKMIILLEILIYSLFQLQNLFLTLLIYEILAYLVSKCAVTNTCHIS